MTSGALLVAGTTSDAGKSLVTAGICRWLVRRGVTVAPFKAQNMSNNSMVTADGAEIGRAQVMQAAAARVPPEAADIARAVRLSRLVWVAAAVLAAGARLLTRRGRS